MQYLPACAGWKKQATRPSKTYIIKFEVTEPTAIFDTDSTPLVSLYPNPSIGILSIETHHSDHYSIEINSINGQLIYNTELEGTTHQIDISSL